MNANDLIYDVRAKMPSFLSKSFKKHPYCTKLKNMLEGDLSFHNAPNNSLSHNFHSFPAKFPPHLPQLFIRELTIQHEVVLDPMMGSGTTILEAYALNRASMGYDIDPLSIMLTKVKTSQFDKKSLIRDAQTIYTSSKNEVMTRKHELRNDINLYFDTKTKEFIDYWFAPIVQIELFALINEINKIDNEDAKAFFRILFSSLIITKSGGVSLALDLGHTRPHKTKILLDKKGNILFGPENFVRGSALTKRLKSPIDEFLRRFFQIIDNVQEFDSERLSPQICQGDAQHLKIESESIDLIVTSPPYASNAIDYMRAHKFSLVWFGYKIDDLTTIRKEYIGGESTTDFVFEEIPEYTSSKVAQISRHDQKRGNVLRRYYSEMQNVLKEVFRVLKPEKAAIVVVGNSIMKGIDTEIPICLSEIGREIGFIIPQIGIRYLERNKRMLPVGFEADLNSQIQRRMHEEYVIGFFKS